ncbi:hypothetical protein ILFOPFJJ_03906 [Ensifer psoraleae]|nr:hypothetical protein [Sinorhizobium psoraleae]
MEAALLIVVMASPLELVLTLLWFGPLRGEQTRPPKHSAIWGHTPQASGLDEGPQMPHRVAFHKR